MKAVAKQIFLLFIAAAFCFSCTEEKISKPKRKIPSSKILLAQLDSACTKNDTTILRRFFEEWYEISKEYAADVKIPNDTVQAVYDVVREFYSKSTYDQLYPVVESTKYNEDFPKTEYFIFDNEIIFTIKSKAHRLYQLDTLYNFFPTPKYKGKRLYVLPEYRSALKEFDWSGFSYMAPHMAIEEFDWSEFYNQKKRTVCPKIHFPYPFATYFSNDGKFIVLDSNLQHSIVVFGRPCETETAIFIRSGNKWIYRPKNSFTKDSLDLIFK